MEIVGVNDRGITSGRHYFELYGNFPSLGFSFVPLITCNGNPVQYANTDYTSPNQVNVDFWDPAPTAATCSFQLQRTLDRAETSVWCQVVDGTRAPIDNGVGAYFWGGFRRPLGWIRSPRFPAGYRGFVTMASGALFACSFNRA
jgi:hypothetical protein